jgi:ferredoxin
MKITDDCISCSACIEECENDAIYDAGSEYVYNNHTYPPLSLDHTFIAPQMCNDCKSCTEVCAVDAIVPGHN